jgi:hypothetical protein
MYIRRLLSKKVLTLALIFMCTIRVKLILSGTCVLRIYNPVVPLRPAPTAPLPLNKTNPRKGYHYEGSVNITTTDRKSFIKRQTLEREGEQHYLKILLIGEEMVAL